MPHPRRARHRAIASLPLLGLVVAILAADVRPGLAGFPKASNGHSVRGPGGLRGPSLSGTLIRQSQGTTSWYLYPGACNDRAGGTWTAKTSPVADSLDSYSAILQDHGYVLEDRSLKEKLWHIDDGSTKVGSFPLPITGSRSLWCGKTDASWVVKSGYPNLTYQILYVDTDLQAAAGGSARTSAYNLSWQQYASSELNYDYLYVIGGGDSTKDPIGNNRARIDNVVSTGSDGQAELLVTFTGVQTVNQTLSYTPGGVIVTGAASGAPSTASISLTGIPTMHRATYFVFISDFRLSSQDGLWPEGHGTVMDLLGASDQTPLLYDDQVAAGGTDAFGGDVLVGTSGNPLISARVPPGVGTLWQIAAGSSLPTGDNCAPQKQLFGDKMFLGADGFSHLTLANTFASIRSCTFGIPPGVASVFAAWGEYLDLPRGSGFVQYTEFRAYRGGAWSDWMLTTPGAVKVWALQAWTTDGAELAEAAQAESVQVRFTMDCFNPFAMDHVNCGTVSYGILYDDFRLQVTTGVPAPTFRMFPGSVAQTTFVDGTDPASSGCSAGQIVAGQCWPGVRGSNLPGGIAIHDNVNSPEGDSITVSLVTGLRKNGMGINWHQGFDKTVGAGLTIARTNNAFIAAYGAPRIIYRLFDPTAKTWSPWDSSELDADAVGVFGVDTVVIDGAYRMNWPPRDKVAAGASLPGGFSVGGKTLYSQLGFLPQGCRMQYYFKAVDINGAVAYRFTTDYAGLEVEELPTLPGSAVIAPDIIEFDVLPRVYPAGAGGTLLAGRTDTPILNLDGSYSAWSNGFDPVTQALRAMGVRADRYRFLQGLGEGANIGGHELPGQRQDLLSSYFPNLNEYDILTKLSNQYRIIIQSSHLRTWTMFEEQDAILVHNWWNTDTGLDGGDRCIFGSGDDMFNALLNASLALPQHTQQASLAQDVFGVASCIGAWTGAITTPYPTITDNFAGINYVVDGGCPAPNRFDGMTKGGAADITIAATYPGGVTELAGVARSTETDALGSTDNDRGKALAYAFSIQFIRTAGIPVTAGNYVHTGVENRMRVLYKFLTSCRGPRTGAMTILCWPCPGNFADMTANWAAAGGFNTAAAGPLYPIQDNTQATGVPDEGPAVPQFVNSLSQNRPNPFNPETAIPYTLAQDGRVAIRIYDVAGRLVRTLVNAPQRAGPQVARWDGRGDGGRGMASGIYFYRIEYPDGTVSARKLTILR